MSGIFRLNPDGSIDPTFDTNEGFANSPQIFDCAVQNDGRILLFTISTEYQGENLGPGSSTPVQQLVIRLNGDTGPVNSLYESQPFDFEMYPNPAREQVTLSDLPENAKISVRDSQGRKVLNYASVQNQHIIPTSSLSEGIYFITVADGARSSFKKLFVNH